jgi:hypothetical protein
MMIKTIQGRVPGLFTLKELRALVSSAQSFPADSLVTLGGTLDKDERDGDDMIRIEIASDDDA